MCLRAESPALINRAEPVWHAASGAMAARLDDGRWHFQHGPIDLIISADGTRNALESAITTAWQRFTTVLGELVEQLPVLRQPLRQPAGRISVHGEVARRMLAACLPYAPQIFITPMAAVAGAVSDTIIQAFVNQPDIRRASVNNGGDIALHLTHGTDYLVGLYADVSRIGKQPLPTNPDDMDGTFSVSATSSIRGIATSGWRGRSFSLGIADSVTVLAASSAQADAAATVIANQVYAEHPCIQRAPANTLKDDSDLNDTPVTTCVGQLPAEIVEQALTRGEQQARALLDSGWIAGAALMLQGRCKVVFAENIAVQSPLSQPAEMLSFA